MHVEVRQMTPAQFKANRNALGLSQRELAIELGLSEANGDRQVRRWEAGKVPIRKAYADSVLAMVKETKGNEND